MWLRSIPCTYANGYMFTITIATKATSKHVSKAQSKHLNQWLFTITVAMILAAVSTTCKVSPVHPKAAVMVEGSTVYEQALRPNQRAPKPKLCMSNDAEKMHTYVTVEHTN